MNAAPRILLVDDDEQLTRAFARTLERAGFTVVTDDGVGKARARMAATPFDVVVTDHAMADGTGLDILDAAHEIDATMPVVYVTGSGDLAIAQAALDHGALRYLMKPLTADKLCGAIEEAYRARVTVGAHKERRRLDADLGDVLLAHQLDGALDGLWLALQPVMSLTEQRVTAYEALLRSSSTVLARPDQIIGAAEKLGRLRELGGRVRAAAAQVAATLPGNQDLLVNLHPSDLDDDDLYDPTAPLSKVAAKVVLEITERAQLEQIGVLQVRLANLRQLGFRIAVDDLGAGYASLSALAMLRPELVKLDMSLIRGIDTDPVRRRIVEGVGAMCAQLGIRWLCEGIETDAELRTVAAAGAELVQGFLLGRPARELAPTSPAIAHLRPARPGRPSQRLAAIEASSNLCSEAYAIAYELQSIPEARGHGRQLAAVVDAIVVALS